MEFLTNFAGNSIYIYEYIKDWCYFYTQSHNEFEFIELDSGISVYSFEDVDENVKFITIHYFIFNTPFQLILNRENTKDFSFEQKFKKIMKSAFYLPNINVSTRSICVKQNILSAVATDVNGKTYHLTQQMNELAGPNGDFYAFSDWNMPINLLLEKLNARNCKLYTNITYIDQDANTHIIQSVKKHRKYL